MIHHSFESYLCTILVLAIRQRSINLPRSSTDMDFSEKGYETADSNRRSTDSESDYESYEDTERLLNHAEKRSKMISSSWFRPTFVSSFIIVCLVIAIIIQSVLLVRANNLNHALLLSPSMRHHLISITWS